MNVRAPAGPRLTTFLVKIASRCNLACDYCYMYEHADQSWREQPHVMGAATRRLLAQRIGEYAHQERPPAVSLVFHGGEPLLAGPDTIVELAATVRTAIPADTRLDVSLQTNGLLLTDEALAALTFAGITVSLSLDGPAPVNDRHRPTRRGGSSFAATYEALRRLKATPETFAGVIAVIDPETSPVEILDFFAREQVPKLDLLLPDAHHARPPEGRESDPERYTRWLLAAFDYWFDVHPHIPLRTFDNVIAAVAGLPSTTDAFGLGDVSLLTIETDGSYHDLDVLKITEAGATAIGPAFTLASASIAEAAASPRLAAHRRLLTLEGLSDTCRVCPEVNTCGGGAVPHRFSGNGFDNPSAYCAELLTLFQHARGRLDAVRNQASMQRRTRGRADAVDLPRFEHARTAVSIIDQMIATWRWESADALRQAAEAVAPPGSLTAALEEARGTLLGASDSNLGRLAIQPGVGVWTRAVTGQRSGRPVRDLSGTALSAEPGYLASLARRLREPAEGPVDGFWVQRSDEWLRAPFGPPIRFLDDQVQAGMPQIQAALNLIRRYSEPLLQEMRRLSPEIQLVQDLSASSEKVVSFSDDSVPGALFVGLRIGALHPSADGWNEAVADFADSLIHEHRHQKLYVLSRQVDLLVSDDARVYSPWRDEFRPPSGVLHAVFVFVELLWFWRWLAETDRALAGRAEREIAVTTARLQTAFPILESTPLTQAGWRLLDLLRERAAIPLGVLAAQPLVRE